jgi:cytochrome P450
VRDECLTVMLAGHETSANALSFALWELARNPGVQERLYQECRTVLGERLPSAEDYGQLGTPRRYLRRRFGFTPRCG